MPATDYAPPVSDLLKLGRPKVTRSKQWPDYLKTHSLSKENIPALIQLATEDALDWQDDDECYAPIHAYRALGQLKAESAIEPLIGLLDDEANDWFTEEVPVISTPTRPKRLRCTSQSG